MSTCTATDCQQPTDRYLCGQCVSDLQSWLNKIPGLHAELFTTMAKLDHTAPQQHEGGGGLSTGSAMPLRAAAMESRHILATWERYEAKELASHENAGDYLPMIRKQIEAAERLIDNPEEHFTFGTCGAETETGPCPETITAPPDATWTNCGACEAPHNVQERAEELRAEAKGEPLPPREAREYLAKKARVHITKKDFENWVYHRQLPYVLDHVGIGEKSKDQGRRIYFPGVVFRVYRDKTERRIAA